MARLVKQMPASGYFQRSGRSAAQYGLKVPETGFFGREFDVQDLGRMVRAGQGIYNLAEDVTEGLVKPVLRELDKSSADDDLKKGRAELKAKIAKQKKEKEDLEKKLKERARIDAERARLDAELERDIQGMQDVPDVSQAVGDIEQRKRAIDAQSEELAALETDHYVARPLLDERFPPALIPIKTEVSPFSGLTKTKMEKGDSRGPVYDHEKGSRRALQQQVNAVGLQRQFPRSPIEQAVSAAMPGQRQLSVDMLGQVAMPAAAAQQTERELLRQAAQRRVPRPTGGSTSPTGTPVSPLAARTSGAQARPQPQPVARRGQRNFTQADDAARRLVESMGMTPQQAADYMVVQQARRSTPAQTTPRFYDNYVQMLKTGQITAQDLGGALSEDQARDMVRGLRAEDWPVVQPVIEVLSERQPGKLWGETDTRADYVEKFRKLLTLPGAQKGIDIDLKGVASMRKSLADARLKEAKADRKQRFKQATRNVPRSKNVDKYADFMADVSVSQQGDKGGVEYVMPMRREGLEMVQTPVPGYGKKFSDLDDLQKRKFVAKLGRVAVDIANANGVEIGRGGGKTRRVKSINDLANLVKVDQRVPIPTPERKITQSQYNGAVANKKRLEAQLENVQGRIDKLEKLGDRPEVDLSARDLETRERQKEAQRKYDAKVKANTAPLKRLYDRKKTLQGQIDTHSTTITNFEKQE